jgi:hypothetical protein
MGDIIKGPYLDVSVTSVDIDSVKEIDIDAGTGLLSLDSATGSITMGTVLGDGQTLKLGPPTATQMVFAPSNTASSEKISLTNISGTDGDAISLQATAGGITLKAPSGVIIGPESATAPAKILFKENSDNGTHAISLVGQESVAADITVVLPATAGTLVLNTDLELKANIASPTFTGTPSAPTASAGTNTTQVATTAFVTTADALKANIASPTFTGTPSAPTASAGTNTTQVATTAYSLAASLAAVTGSVTTISTLLNASLKLGRDATNIIDFGTDDVILFDIDNTEVFRVYAAGVHVGGAITAAGDITAYSSDNRLKTNIEIINDPLSKINKLSGFTYDWARDKCIIAGFDANDEKQIGVFAQDVQSVIPEAVKLAPFDRDDNGNSKSGDNYLTVQYEKIVPLLIESIKEQQKQINELRNEVELLKK